MLSVFVVLVWLLVYALGVAGISAAVGLGELQALYTISAMAAWMLPFRKVCLTLPGILFAPIIYNITLLF